MLSDRLTFNSKAAGADIGPNLFVWGENLAGQLGLGDTLKRSSPVQLVGTWTQVHGNYYHTFAQRPNNQWYGWGSGHRGGLGLGDTINRSSPTLLPGTWLSIKPAFSSTTLGLRPDGSLWSWGYGHQGALGLGDTIWRSSPVQIAGTWKEIATFRFGGHAIRSNGSLWVWGYNSRGGLGSSDVVLRSSPIQLAGTWVSLTSQLGRYRAGGAIKADGSLWMWGNNEFGEGGISIIGNISSPTQVVGTWKKAAESDGSTLAIRHDGTLWTWGYKPGGQLGLGDSTVSRSSPVQVGTGQWSDITSTPTGAKFAIGPTGSASVWGYNNKGQLGLGDSGVNRSSPVQLAGTWKSITGILTSAMGLKF